MENHVEHGIDVELFLLVLGCRPWSRRREAPQGPPPSEAKEMLGPPGDPAEATAWLAERGISAPPKKGVTRPIAVAESAAVGQPDEIRGEVIKSYIVLRDGFEPSDALAEEIRQQVRERLSTHAFPRVIEFVDELPKTPSGKIQRFKLRAQAAEQVRDNS